MPLWFRIVEGILAWFVLAVLLGLGLGKIMGRNEPRPPRK